MEQLLPPNDLRASANRELDLIDSQILSLLLSREDAVNRLSAALKQNGFADTPFQTARDTENIRTLVNLGDGKMSAEDIVRFWRVLIARSETIKCSARLACPQSLLDDHQLRDICRDHFPGLAIAEHADSTSAVKALARSKRTIAVVPLTGEWPQAIMDNKVGGAEVITTLPLVKQANVPLLAVVGHSISEATGDDETLVVTAGRLPRDFVPTPLWQIPAANDLHLSCLPGYMSLSEGPLLGLKRSNPALALCRLGRYPSPIEV